MEEGSGKIIAGQLSPHFYRKEFACSCGCGFDTVDAELIRVLEEMRTHFFGRRVIITSGCRCMAHNREVGGYPMSCHLLGQAADFWVQGVAVDHVADYLENLYPGRYGIGRYGLWVHLDVRKKEARWADD